MHGVSERRGCTSLGVDRSTIRYRSTNADQALSRLRIRDLAQARVRYGYFRIYILLRREEGWLVNHQRVYRLYREDGLSLRLRGCLETFGEGGWPGRGVIPDGCRSQSGQPHVDPGHPSAA